MAKKDNSESISLELVAQLIGLPEGASEKEVIEKITDLQTIIELQDSEIKEFQKKLGVYVAPKATPEEQLRETLIACHHIEKVYFREDGSWSFREINPATVKTREEILG